ncbi:MAG: YqjK-like family protein [Sulfuritalea sp.]|nr:YqjK-like family protein [Sulfuritalea sp.]
MSLSAIEFALKKQRLQIAGEGLRADIGRYSAGLSPVFNAGDYVVNGAHWVRRNPQFLVAASVALIVVRPKTAWRMARRAFFAWQIWRKLDKFLVRQLKSST